MVRGVYIQRAPAERMTVEAAQTRYLKEVPPTKRASTQAGERKKAQASSAILASTRWQP